jgi:hypothetical protein
MRIAPPYSRNYDFMAGTGVTHVWTEVIGGWTTETYTGSGASFKVTGSGYLTSGNMTLEGAELLDSINAGGYQTPASVYATATTTGTAAQRSLDQLWGTPTNDTNADFPVRHLSMYSNLTVGCTSGYYGPQDMLFGAILSGSQTGSGADRKLAIISNVLDSSGSPYGTLAQSGVDGSNKPDHLAENISCALASYSSTTAALVTTYFDADSRNPVDTGLTTNILFPVNTANLGDTTYPTVLVNGTALNALNNCTVANSITTCPLATSSVITLQGINGGVVGVKLLESTLMVTPTQGSSYQIELDAQGSTPNPSGSSNGVGRIVATHATAAKTSSTVLPERLSFLVVTDNGSTPSLVSNILTNATFTSTLNSNTGERTLLVTFGGTYLPGGTLNSLQVVRSESNLADPGTATATPALPGISSALTSFALDGSGTKTDLAANFWKVNAFTSTDATFSCATALCVAP